MFNLYEKYGRKLENIADEIPKILDTEATNGGLKFVQLAVRKTNKAKAVDTGYYKRGWNAKKSKTGETYYITLSNNVEYASLLENGYRIKKDHFVPFDKMQGTPKTKKLIRSFRKKYPNAKGFIAKARTVKGLFIGKLSREETREYIIKRVHRAIRKAIREEKAKQNQ